MSRARAGIALLLLLFLPAVALASEGEVTQHKDLAAGPALLVDLPKGCFAKAEYPCAIRVSERGELRLGSAKFLATPEAELRITNVHEILILSGTWRLQQTENLTVKFGEIRLVLAGDALIERGSEGLQVANLNGQMKLKNGDVEASVVPTGFRSLVAGLDGEGRLVQRELRASEPLELMNRLLHVTGAGYADVRAKAPEYREFAKKAVGESAALYQSTIQNRQIASEAAAAKAAQKRAAVEAERQRFRTMFRERFYGEAD